jgi:two-component system chemotaxis response regulator CheB
VILTGMGRDGAAGLLALRRAGGTVLAQDEASCAVPGMPAAAVAAGAVDEVVSLEDMGARIAASWTEPAC